MGSLYVGNLNPDCTEATLYHKFAAVGNLLNIRLCKDKKTGNSLGYGFVYYASKTDAEIALVTLNYTTIKDRSIRLMWAERNIKQLPSNANIFIKNLDYDIDEKTLHDIFSYYGNILSLRLATQENGDSKGYAFIQYEDEKSAEEAICGVHGKLLRGKVVYVTKFLPRDQRLPKQISQFQNVYIKNFDAGTTDEDLVEMCRDFGPIVNAKVMLDDAGNSKCFGFVSFKDPESAREAIKALNGRFFKGRQLFADRAKKKTERQREVMENLRLKCEEMEKSNVKIDQSF